MGVKVGRKGGREEGREGGREGGTSTWLEGAVAHDQDVKGISILTQRLRDEA